MALYHGSDKVKLNMDGSARRLNIVVVEQATPGSIRLLSSDNYLLKDSEGKYLTVPERG